MARILFRAAVVVAVASAGIALATPVSAQQSGDVVRGASLALTWCVVCHVVDAKGTGPTFAIPPVFPDVARDPKTTPDFIRVRLSASHTLMPKMALTERDKDDLIAYILSLR